MRIVSRRVVSIVLGLSLAGTAWAVSINTIGGNAAQQWDTTCSVWSTTRTSESWPGISWARSGRGRARSASAWTSQKRPLLDSAVATSPTPQVA